MVLGSDQSVAMIARLLSTAIEEAGAKDRRQHELRIKELQIIENSDLRDEYVKQLMINRMLHPIEKAQLEIQDAAKHAQWLSEEILFKHDDHRLSLEEARELSKQLKLLAIEITHANTLHELKMAYSITTLFNHRVSKYLHAERKKSVHYEIRHGILNRLNSCIAAGNNFRLRSEAAS